MCVRRLLQTRLLPSLPLLQSSSEAAKVVITGSAGQIAYSLIFAVARGEMLGSRPVILHLLDIAGMETKLEAIAMELEDCASPIVAGVFTCMCA